MEQAKMYNHLLVPQAPLVFRSGRPFGEGSRDGANHPWPSSLAGLLRTQVMDDDGWQGKLNAEQQQKLRKMSAHGPILARRTGSGITAMLARPADALLLDDGNGGKTYHRLAPGTLPPGCACDLPPGMQPLLLAGEHKGKPQVGPAFWPLSTLLDWRRGEERDAGRRPRPPVPDRGP